MGEEQIKARLVKVLASGEWVSRGKLCSKVPSIKAVDRDAVLHAMVSAGELDQKVTATGRHPLVEYRKAVASEG